MSIFQEESSDEDDEASVGRGHAPPPRNLSLAERSRAARGARPPRPLGVGWASRALRCAYVAHVAWVEVANQLLDGNRGKRNFYVID